MNAQPQPRILCVDDESRIVDGLALQLRKDFEVFTALSGAQALQTLRDNDGFAVVVSDMRMPGMDGAALLQQVKKLYPAATRILLTGEQGREVAVVAVNKGQIFRFLTKPCAPDQLRAAVEAGVMQHRLVNAERAVLQETLLGAIKALVDVLAIIQPAAFGRAGRLARCATQFATHIGCTDFWQLDAAAILSQLGCLSLPQLLINKINQSEPLTAQEQALAAEVPAVAVRLLEHIPRLEPVTQILAALGLSDAQLENLGDSSSGLGARILGMALHYDALSVQGHGRDVVLQSLRTRSARFGRDLIEKFATHLGAGSGTNEVRDVVLSTVQPGMMLLHDVHMQNNILLVPKGFEVTATFVERIANFGPEVLARQVQVLMPAKQAALQGQRQETPA